MFRTAKNGLVAVSIASCSLFSASVASAQQNPIIAATQAPPPIAASPFGLGYGYGPYSPYSPYGPYGSPYGGGYPYSNNNPALNSLTNPQQNPNNAVPGQPTQPGQVQLGQGGGQGGGGQGGNGGSQGGNGGGQGNQQGGGGDNGGKDPAKGASFDVMQDPASPLYKRYERDLASEQIRPKTLTQIGRGKGIRRGFLEEAQRLRAAVEGEAASRLDTRYNFSGLMIGEHLVPPVIGEIHDVQQRGGDRLLYLTVGAFQIVRPARLVITPPNWRDYLFIETADPQTAIPALGPQNSGEQTLYDNAYDEGLAKGVAEARETFDDNLNRLERDFSGMERYQELARQGAVSLPVVNDAKRAVRVAENGQRAFVGEQIVTLRVTPRFKAARKAAFK